MPRQTLTWIPPSLCGCVFKIAADFTDVPADGVSFRHPTPYTITSLEIVSCCQAHLEHKKSMPDVSGLFGVDSITGELVQQRGYLKHPVAQPTEAECLYTFLAQFNGQTHSYPCGCSSHQFVDEKKNVTYLAHPKHTRRCHRHREDGHDMRAAKADFDKQMAESNPGL